MGARGAYPDRVWNLGLAEIAVIVVIGLLIFGPDKLPKAIKTLSGMLQNLRSAATDASRSLQDAAGWDSTETRQTLSDLADLHPKRLMGSILDEGEPKAAAKPDAAPAGRAPTAPKSDPSDFDPEAP